MSVDVVTISPLIQVHLGFACVALVSGSAALFRKRRDGIHKALGRVWVAAVVALSLTGLLIESPFALIGHFGPIHVFSLIALWGVGEGLWHIRRGNIAAHAQAMRSVWFGGMGLATLFTFLPGRVLHQVIFGDAWALGINSVLAAFAGFLWIWHRASKGLSP